MPEEWSRSSERLGEPLYRSNLPPALSALAVALEAYVCSYMYTFCGVVCTSGTDNLASSLLLLLLCFDWYVGMHTNDFCVRSGIYLNLMRVFCRWLWIFRFYFGGYALWHLCRYFSE